jgi:hypothetical protein
VIEPATDKKMIEPATEFVVKNAISFNREKFYFGLNGAWGQLQAI